jgi:hypothetical protein
VKKRRFLKKAGSARIRGVSAQVQVVGNGCPQITEINADYGARDLGAARARGVSAQIWTMEARFANEREFYSSCKA